MKTIGALYKVLYRKLKQKSDDTTVIEKKEPKTAKVISLYRKEPSTLQHAKVVSMFTY